MLIVDAGNSKTDWALISRENKISYYQTPGVSPYFDSDITLIANFTRAFVNLNKPQPKKILYFGTGCLFEKQCSRIFEALSKIFLSASEIKVSDDLTGAAIALFGNSNGVAVILGTGSNAGIYQDKRINKRTDSLGYLLGDEGSGADIGFRFLKALLSGRLPSQVIDAFFEQTGLDKTSLITNLYSAPRPQAFAASFLPFLNQFIQKDDIKTLVFDSFNRMVDIVLIPLIGGKPDLPIGFCGGVAETFKAELTEVMKCRGIVVMDIIHKPAKRLAAYFADDENAGIFLG